ncbi:aldehyde dehydrogenase family protein, partial [Streptomyces sp. NPDC041003]|uniref:aldehyde dehydrogenase family protein n=1 Tax=Streptomyces sp. NPDC041003 TaxID=3155730 RepID=UPI0034104EC7
AGLDRGWYVEPTLFGDVDNSMRIAREEIFGPARVRVDLAGALRYLPARLEEAAGQLTTALERAGGDPELRVAALVCLARVHRERYARDADPAALEEAAEAYGRARRLIPRDGEAFGELLPEWGEVLLERARAADGRRFTGAAVRVLRDSRAAVPQSDPGAAHRLVRLATGLRLRHAYEGDPVDLREAEYLLELAVRHGRSPLERARAWRDHGDVQQEIHGHTRAVERLDRAADSYRRAWRAALEADLRCANWATGRPTSRCWPAPWTGPRTWSRRYPCCSRRAPEAGPRPPQGGIAGARGSA